jgi:alpha-beta hydrolase superfamily lysophospholipase
MVIQAKAIKTIYLILLCSFLSLSSSSQALENECVTVPKVSSSSSSIGSRCAEDPACVIVGGTHMLEWKSPTPAKIVVVCIHGLGLCARAYKPLAQELSAVGIDGFGVNVRGFGPDRDKPDRAKLNCVETVGDVSQLLTSIRKEHPDYKVFLIGESMGGALAIRIAAENPDLIDGVICSAPAWKLLKMRRTAVKGVFELFLFPGSGPGLAGRAVMHQATTDTELTQHWLSDPSHKLKLSLGEASSFLSFIKKTDIYARQFKKPVLIVQGLNDHLVSPKAVAKLFRDMASSNKTLLIDGKGEHLVLEEGRFCPALLAKLIDWVKTDTVVESTRNIVETVDDEGLSAKEKHHLSILSRSATLVLH